MKALIEQFYPIIVSDIQKLGGYDNANYLVITDYKKYIFKTYLASEKEFVDAETRALHHLNSFSISKPIRGITDKYFYETVFNGEKIIIRLLSFLDGDFMKDVPLTDVLLQSFGSFLAELDLSLKHFKNFFIQGNQHSWDNQYWKLNEELIQHIAQPTHRKIVEHFFQQYEENVVPKIPNLRKQIIHNDANTGNVLVKKGIVSGIIDLGDIAYSFLVNDISNAIAYAILGQKKPLNIAATLLKAYTKKLPLLVEEIDVLYYLIATRLSVSVCNSAHAKVTNPDNRHIFTTEKDAFELLEKWIDIDSIVVQDMFRKAAGFDIQNA